MYIEILSDLSMSDEAIRGQIEECLRDPCALCNGWSYKVAAWLATQGAQALMGTLPGRVGVVAIPLCRGCSEERIDLAKAAICRAFAEVAREKGVPMPDLL